MEELKAPEKIYIPRLISDGKLIHEWNDVPFEKFRFFFDKEIAENIEYTRTDAFIEKACDWLKANITNNLNCDRVISRKGVVTMGMLIDDFKNYMKGE